MAALGLEEDALQGGRNVGVDGEDAVFGRIHDGRRLHGVAQNGDDGAFRAGDKPFAARRFERGLIRHHLLQYAGRRFRGMAGHVLVQIIHDVAPHGRGARHARHVPHGLAIEVTHPYTHRVARRVAHAPVVAHVLARARLDGAPEIRPQFVAQAKRHAARGAVGQDIADDEGGARPHHAAPVLAGLPRLQAGRAVQAAVGQRAVGVGQFQQGHFGRAQRQRGAVVLGRFRQARQAHFLETVVKAILPRQQHRAHGGNVQGAGQAGAGADVTLEIAVVVLRRIHAGRRGDVERRVVHDGRGRHQPALDRQFI
ncbi:hypothetical protein D3C87_864560 [compost metagenome]